MNQKDWFPIGESVALILHKTGTLHTDRIHDKEEIYFGPFTIKEQMQIMDFIDECRSEGIRRSFKK